MKKRIVSLAVPLAVILLGGLMAVQSYFASFPPAKTVIERLSPLKKGHAVSDITELFIDDSGSMKGYYSSPYIYLLRAVKTHIREHGDYRYYSFSDPENVIGGDAWKAVEDILFYQKNNTYFDNVLDSISKRSGDEAHKAKHYVIITDGIQDASRIQDYSRIVNKVSDLLDADMYFQIVALQLYFSGNKYPEGGGQIVYEGDSPLYCYIFSYQYDYGKDLYEKLKGLNLPAEFLGFGNGSIHASIRKFSDPPQNPDGSRNIFKRFKDEVPVSYLVSAAGTGGTLLTDVAFKVKDITVDMDRIQQKIPEFCGSCLSMDSSEDNEQRKLESKPGVTVSSTETEVSTYEDDSMGIAYEFYFKDWNRDSTTVACDLTLCNWLPVNPPGWVDSWSSDCDNSRECFHGRTPFLSAIINPLLNKSVNQYTFGYAVIRNK